MTRYVKLLGYPLEHSISPAFQQAAFDKCGLDVRYELCELRHHQLKTTMDELRQPSSLGANVTVPYKEAVLPLLDELDGLSTRIGAVNTIVNRNGKLIGHNTDAEGFLWALRHEGHFEPQGKRVVVLGAGGAARAVGFALIETGVSSLTIVGRNHQRAEALVEALASPGTEIATVFFDDERLSTAVSGCDLLVNCTPVGMKYSSTEGESPLDVRLVPKGALVYDVVYNPAETRLLRDARGLGASTLGGLPMLVYQGGASFKLWTGQGAPIDIMFEAARKALEE